MLFNYFSIDSSKTNEKSLTKYACKLPGNLLDSLSISTPV